MTSTLTASDAHLVPFDLAAIDLDDTLLGPDKRIGDANRAAVAKLRAAGAHVILASGRRHDNMLRFHRDLELQGPIVSCSGALTMVAETGEILHRQVLERGAAHEIVKLGLDTGWTILVYGLEQTYTNKQGEFTELYERRTGNVTALVPDLLQVLDRDVLKVLWVGSPADVAEHTPPMTARYAGVFEVVATDPEYLEFMADGVSKAVGVGAAAAYYGIPRSRVVAFGDGNNDVALLAWAGLGVAMSHARISARQAADITAPNGAEESSFARAVDVVFARNESFG